MAKNFSGFNLEEVHKNPEKWRAPTRIRSPKPGPWPPVPESKPMPPSSWAKKTGFRPKFSVRPMQVIPAQLDPLQSPGAQIQLLILSWAAQGPIPTANGPRLFLQLLRRLIWRQLRRRRHQWRRGGKTPMVEMGVR
ncbi:Nucleobase-ascorbate transporter 12 [Bienertia sinuspersici]